MIPLKPGRFYMCKNKKIVKIKHYETPEDPDFDHWNYVSDIMWTDGEELSFSARDNKSSNTDADEEGYIIIKRITEEENPEAFL